MKKSMQIKVGKLLTEFAFELRNAFMSEFAITVSYLTSFYLINTNGEAHSKDKNIVKPLRKLILSIKQYAKVT